MNKERKEAFMRILVGIISGIILEIWGYLVAVIAIFHWIYVMFEGKKSKQLSKFCNLWVAQVYRFFRYITFASSKRAFPFADLSKEIEAVEE